MTPTIAGISLSLHGRTIVAIFLALAVFSGAYFYYLTTLPPLPGKKRILLAGLRGGALTLLVLLLFEPLLRFVGIEDRPPVVAVLLDDSQSMTIVDGRGDRASAIRSFIRRDPFTARPAGSRVHYYTFSTDISKPSDIPPDSMRFTGQTTDLNNSLHAIQEAQQEDNIQAVVLLTDGVFTAGKNPLYLAEGLGIPVYTVGVGDTAEQKDVLVDRVVANSMAYAEERIPVDVTIRSHGYQHERVEVTIRDGTKILDRAVVTLGGDGFVSTVHLGVVTAEEGTKRYVVEVSHLPGELTEKNNSRPVFIHIIKNRLRLVILAGAPSPDLSVITQTLSEDRHYSFRSFVQKSPAEFYGGDPPAALFDSADCFLLVGYPTAASNSAVLQRVADEITQKNKPVFFCNGKLVDYAKLGLFAQSLPFGWPDPVTRNEIVVTPAIPENAKSHPLILLEGNGTSAGWQKLPPVYRTQSGFHLKPGSTALVTITAQNIPLPEPLVAVRSVAHQRAVAVTGYGIWRWKLMAQGDVQTEHLLSEFIASSVRWLTSREDDKRVKVIAAKEMFTTAEPAQFIAQVYTEELRPADNADVTLDVVHSHEKIPVALRPVGNGRYEGTANGLPEGEYTFHAAAAINGTPAGEDQGRFTVGMMNGEFLETRMNRSLLEQIAYRTSGNYFPIDRSDSLETILHASRWNSKEVVHQAEIEIWNWRYAALAIICLLGIEWFLRKRNGML
jgi:hypothetical protein